MTVTRRKLLRASAAVPPAALVGLAAAACRPSLPLPETKVTPALALTVAVPTGGLHAHLNKAIADAVHGALPAATGAGRGRYTLAVVEVPLPSPTPGRPYQSQMVTMAPLLGSGDPPDLLVFTSFTQAASPPNETRGALAFLQPLDDHLKADRTLALGEFFPAALDLCRRKGQLLALPLMAAPQMLLYDSGRFAQAGVAPPTSDWDWRRFEGAARRLTRDTDGNGAPDEYGFSPGGWGQVVLPFLWQNGGDVVSPDKKRALLAEAASVEALEFVAGLSRDPPAMPRTPANSAGSGPDGIRFGNLWCAMGYAGAWLLQGGPVMLAELPQGRQRAAALAVLATLSVSRKAEDPAVATAALAALAEQVTKELVPPARRLPPQALQALEPRLTTEGAQRLANSLGYSRGIGVGDMDKTAAILDTLNSSLFPALQGGARTPAEAAQAANDAIQRILDRS